MIKTRYGKKEAEIISIGPDWICYGTRHPRVYVETFRSNPHPQLMLLDNLIDDSGGAEIEARLAALNEELKRNIEAKGEIEND